VTAEDQEHLLALFDAREAAEVRDKCAVVPICVDPEIAQPVRRAGEGPPTILHLGTMFWPPNIAGVLWFAREVLPRVHQAVPEARLVIAGKAPPREVRRLTSDHRIKITGYVADPTPCVAAADVFVVPLHAAGGMRVKILDAWLWGLPVVSTSIGAEGIECCDGENILLAPDAEAFAAAVVRLLSDKQLNDRLRAEGRKWVEARYDWRRVYRGVDDTYARLLEAAFE
jgi:glycosyltransferase involved in cell wall biosynthesis